MKYSELWCWTNSCDMYKLDTTSMCVCIYYLLLFFSPKNEQTNKLHKNGVRKQSQG